MSETNEVQTPATGTNLVPALVDDSKAPLVPLSQTMAGPRADYWASWPVATAADRVQVHNARNQECLKMDSQLGKTLMLRGVIAHHASVETDGGEVQECIRCVLIVKDGPPVACVSGGIVESVRDLMSNFGEGPWEPPLPVIPRQVQTRKGRRTYKLEVDASYLDKQPKDSSGGAGRGKQK